MAVKRKNYFKNDTEYTVSYRDMRGVDFSGSGASISPTRFSYLENMYRDYDGEGAGVTESVPGFRKILGTGKTCNGIFSYTAKNGTQYVVLHAGPSLYQFAVNGRDSIGSIKSIATLYNTKSHAYSSGGKLYVFDGASIHILDEYGAHRMGDSGYEAYIPTTYINGEPYEQRNLLSNKFRETFFVDSAAKYAKETAGIQYAVISDEAATVKVTGIDNYCEDVTICIPSRVKLGEKEYSVVEIAPGSFVNNVDIEKVVIAEGVTKIGSSAFMGCASLEEVYTPTTIEKIGAGAFAYCHNLWHVFIGGGILYLPKNAFEECDSLEAIDYELSESEFSAVETTIEKTFVNMNAVNTSVIVELPIYSKCKIVEGVIVDGVQLSAATKYDKDIHIVIGACLDFADKALIEGKTVTIVGTLYDDTFSEYEGFSEALVGTQVKAADAIIKTTVSESFDGRVFLAGNRLLPNTVFYSARDKRGVCNPLYFGALNYFNDGVGSFRVTSMLAAADSLAVFKSADDGCGSIYYHTPRETGIDLVPKIYPVSSVHSGIGCKGASLSFFDDPVFVSAQGISALERADISGKRSVVTRSHAVNPRLLSENLDAARLAQWCGYLAVLTEGQIFLADSRASYVHESGGREYEWYYLNGIGTYKNDTRVYRYASVAHTGYEISGIPDARVSSTLTVYSAGSGDSEVLYVLGEDGKKYEVYKTEEMEGGVFSPATHILGVNDLLFFGTKSGDLCVFNNDKRGTAPTYLAEMEDFDAEEYAAVMKRRIHPSFYSFASHAPRYALKTLLDNCGIPHLTKNTVKHSLTLKCKSYAGGAPICEVGTDRNGYSEITSLPGGELDFCELDFSTFSLLTGTTFTVPIAEKEKGWVEKQLALWSDRCFSPFGVYSLTYRFTVKGRIKKQ
ncbi:MAG: leucine-rich repeat domain-containing protein [Clostridia bacterium]|nr:leucine-rich repeat domain-containing protein [Clostridia bacterium]